MVDPIALRCKTSPGYLMIRSMTLLLFGLLAAFASTSAAAENRTSPHLIKSYGAWGFYSYTSNGKTRCYTLSTPDQSLPAHVDHGNNYFIIASYPVKKGFYPEAVMGYAVKASAPMSVSVDDQTFAMVAKGSTGWAQQLQSEPAIIAAMRAGSSMTVKAVSGRGTKTSYHYSLAGVTAALSAAARCRR